MFRRCLVLSVFVLMMETILLDDNFRSLSEEFIQKLISDDIGFLPERILNIPIKERFLRMKKIRIEEGDIAAAIQDLTEIDKPNLKWSSPYPSKQELRRRYEGGRTLGHRKNHEPPFYGTVYIEKGILPDNQNISVFTTEETKYLGRRCHRFYDQSGWIVDDKGKGSYVFKTYFADGVQTEFWLHSQSANSTEDARRKVHDVGRSLGLTPQFLRVGARVVQIMDGEGSFSANTDGILHIYYDEFVEEQKSGYVEEILLHELAHTSLDLEYYGWVNWEDAAAADAGYVSYYAEEDPEAEDVSESITNWIGVALRTLSEDNYKCTIQQIPNRLQLLDDQNFNLYPWNNGINPTNYVVPKDYEWQELKPFYYPYGKEFMTAANTKKKSPDKNPSSNDKIAVKK